MSEQVTVGISDAAITRGEGVLVTFALGSCVGICLYNAATKLAALGHIMLPESQDKSTETQINKYADTCIPAMVKKMQAFGCNPANLTAKIAGGAKMFSFAGDNNFGNIGNRNVKAVKEALQKCGVRLIAEDTGADYGRTVYFYAADGHVEVKSFSHGVNKL